jgi:subtilisin family serine protease
MVVKVAQSGGTANYSDIAAGVVYAAQKGARVINLSLGGTSDSVTLRTAIAQAAQTATIVAGVGNSDSTTKIYPAAYDDHVIAVAGTGRADAKVATSNYGPWVDLAAPGEEITTTFPGGTWGVTSGTSMAAPFVAGVAGLVRSHQPAWSPTSTRQQLLNTADDIDAANTALGTGQLGRGRVNAYAALTTAAAPLLAVAGTSVNGLAGGTVKLGVEVPVVVTLRNGWLDATRRDQRHGHAEHDRRGSDDRQGDGELRGDCGRGDGRQRRGCVRGDGRRRVGLRAIDRAHAHAHRRRAADDAAGDADQ